MGSTFAVSLLLLFELCYGLPIRKCYFDKYDKKVSRDIFPQFSETKAECCGDFVTLEYVNKNHPVNPKFLFGARHIADLILTRTGDFVNWDDPEERQIALARTICVCHLDELFKKFDNRNTKHVKHYRKCGKNVAACTMAQEISGHHFGQNRDPKFHLTRDESEAILKTVNQVIQTGIPLCDACKKWAVDKLKQYQAREICEQQGACYIDKEEETEVENNTCDVEMSSKKDENDSGENNGGGDSTAGLDDLDDIDAGGDDDWDDGDEVEYSDKMQPKPPARKGKRELINFAKIIGMDTSFGLVTTQSFSNVKRQSQRKKIKGGKVLFKEMSSLIAPGSEKFFEHDICSDEMEDWVSSKDTKKEEFLQNLAVLYENEPDKEFKLHYLSHMIPLVSLEEIQKYVKVSPHYYKKAIAYALNPQITKVPHIGFERWNHQQLEYFIKFITGPTIVTGLPYKSVKGTLSTGEKIDIPSLLRLQRSKQIIELYKKKLSNDNMNHLLLPESTMYKILNFCVATKTKSLKCVDYYLVDAGEANYFGKKGIGYHIVHALTKIGEFLAEHTFVHIVESATQKSYEVLAILDDVVAELKEMGIVEFIGRSDNAGCYRSTELIMGLNKVGKNNDAEVNRWTFSEVQTGKGPCDRKAGVVKERVDERVSQKYDVTTAYNFYDALTDPYVIPYMTIVHVSIANTGKTKVKSFPNIQLYSDYNITDDGVIAYKAAGIGDGLQISSKNYEDDIKIADLTTIRRATTITENDVNKKWEKHRIANKLKTKFWNTIRDPLAEKNPADNDPLAFPCPEEFCDVKCLTMEELEAHIESGNHTVRKPERETLRTHALKIYQQCANDLLAETNELSAAQLTFCATANENDRNAAEFDFYEGNALRTGKKKCNAISDKARKFVKNLFDLGEKDSSKKVSHEKVVQMMEAAKDPQNPSLPLFRATELLTSQQINGLFTRFKKANTDKKRKHDEEEEEEVEITCGDGEEDDDEDDESEAPPPPKKPRRSPRRKGLKNRLQMEEEEEIEEIRKEARKSAAQKTF